MSILMKYKTSVFVVKNLISSFNQIRKINLTSVKHINSDELNEKHTVYADDHLETNDLNFKKSLVLCVDFLNKIEENNLLNEIEPYMKRLRYEFDHWDDAIHGYRETERLEWKPENRLILDRVRKIAFESFKDSSSPKNLDDENLLAHVHILDMHKDGYIKPHVDSIRFCGNKIAGLCLLSDSIMRFKNVKNPLLYANVLLKRRSLYIIKDYARYEFTHEILKNSESYFRDKHVPRDRRISIICRNKPDPKLSEN